MGKLNRASGFTLFLLVSLFYPSVSETTDSFLFGGCTQQKYPPDSPYRSNVDSLLASLVNSATYSTYNNFNITGSTVDDIVYGLYQCRGDLAIPDCATCVGSAVTKMGSICSQTCGGAVQLEGCYVKYDNVTFLGMEDKTVILKKCGPSVGCNRDATCSTDEVLSELAGSGGTFRVVGSGNVQGMAQCTGDLSFIECQDCIREAIGQLRSDCGTADYGYMFLGKCYARYSTGGAHAYSKAHENSSSEGEKTFAVIVGLLAGVAVLIIFVTFLRKAFERQGK